MIVSTGIVVGVIMMMAPILAAQDSISVKYQLTKVVNKMTDEINIDNIPNVHSIEEGCPAFEKGNCYHPEAAGPGWCPGLEKCPFRGNESSEESI